MNTAISFTDAVRVGLAQLEEAFDLSAENLGDGGAIATVRNLGIGERWIPSVIDLSFEIAFNYPFAAIYPYFTQTELTRVDGQQFSALQRVSWRGGTWTQISLRANRWNPHVDTAVGAVLQVQRWFEAT